MYGNEAGSRPVLAGSAMGGSDVARRERELDKIEMINGLMENTIHKAQNFLTRLTGEGFPQDAATKPMEVGYLGQINRLYGLAGQIDELVNRLSDIG